MNNPKKPKSGKRKLLTFMIRLVRQEVDFCNVQSALATSAAPIYFKTFERCRPPKVYSDGALKANLPVEYAVSETQKIWPPSIAGLRSDRTKKPYTGDRNPADSIENRNIEENSSEESDISESSLESLKPLTYSGHVHLDVLVSVGTGEQQRIDSYPSAFEVGGLKEAYLSFIKAMDTEASWNEFKAKTTYDKRRHYRLNIPINGNYVRLDDWSQMQKLQDSVHECYSTSVDRLNILQDVASRLTASLLFFEPTAPSMARLQPRDRFRRIQGQIWCRLARDTSSLRALVERISGFWIQEANPRGPSPYVEVTLKDDWKSEIRTEGKHLALPVTLKTTEPESVISLAVSLRDVCVPGDPLLGDRVRVRKIPISGFPVVYKDLEAKITPQ